MCVCCCFDNQCFVLILQAGYESEGEDGEEEQDLEKTEWMGNNPPYAEAVCVE